MNICLLICIAGGALSFENPTTELHPGTGTFTSTIKKHSDANSKISKRHYTTSFIDQSTSYTKAPATLEEERCIANDDTVAIAEH